MKYKEAQKYYGSDVALANALELPKQSMTKYKKNGIPLLRQIQLEDITNGNLKADPKPWLQPQTSTASD